MPDAYVQRITRGLELAALGFALVLLVVQVGAPGWGRAAELTTAAYRLSPGISPGAPGHAVLGKLASLLPVGDVAFRVAAVSVLGVLAALAGMIALARALVPAERVAGAVAAAIAATTPAVLAAGTSAGPDAVVAALVVWSTAFAVRARRGDRAPRRERGAARPGEAGACQGGAIAAVGLAIATIAVQPVVGLAVVAPIAAAVIRRRAHAIVAGGLALASLAVWALVLVRPTGVTDLSSWFAAGVSLDAGERAANLVTALGHGSGGPLLLAGTLGLGFAAATSLRGAALPLIVASSALVAAVTVGGGPGRAAPALLLLGAGLAPLAGAVARTLARSPTPRSRLAIGAASAAPVVLLAMLAPPTDLVDPGGAYPVVAARSVFVALPAGPGAVALTHDALWSGARLEQAIAGERPDLDVIGTGPGVMELAVLQLRAGRPVGSDVAAFDLLDPRLAAPRDRGFQLLLEVPQLALTPRPPATWTGPTGARLAEQLAIARAEYEAVNGRLDAAAVAAGLVDSGRFHAADLALLRAARPTVARPALFAYLPPLASTRAIGFETLLLGDDLAWVAGLELPVITDDDFAERRLHARWRDLLTGARAPEDPALRALGRAAVQATVEAMRAVGRADLADRARVVLEATGE